MRKDKRTGIICAVLLAGIACGVPVRAMPPEKTLESFNSAVNSLETVDVELQYIATTMSTMAEKSGNVLVTTELQERVTVKPGEKPVRETLYQKTVGEDKEAAKSAEKAKKEDSGSRQTSFKARLPMGEDLPLFSFGKTVSDGTVAYADFIPVPSEKNKDGMTKGRLYWHAVTGHPIRIEAELLKKPAFTSKAAFTFHFSETGGRLYPSRFEINGEGGFLFIQRVFTVTAVISDIIRKN